MTAVVGQRSTHQPRDTAIHLDGVDLRGAVDERVLDVDPATGTDDQDARPRQQLVRSGDDAGAEDVHVAGAVEYLRRRAAVEEHEVRVRTWCGVPGIDEVAVHRAGRQGVVVDDIDPGMRIPAGRQMSDVLAVHGPLRRSGLWRRDRVTGQRERRGDRPGRDHAGDGPHPRAGHSERREGGKTSRDSIQAGRSEPWQTDEGEKAPRRGACEVRRIETARPSRVLAQAANDDPAREEERQRARDVRDQDRRGQRRTRIDVRLEEERRDRAGRGGERERGKTWSPRTSIEDAAQRRAAPDAQQRHADDEIRQVIAV